MMSVQRVLMMTHAASSVRGAVALYLRMFDVAEAFRARLEPQERTSQVVRIGEFYVEVVKARPLEGTIGEYSKRYGGYFPSMCFVVSDISVLHRRLERRITRIVKEREHLLAVELYGVPEMVWEFTDLQPEAAIVPIGPKRAAHSPSNDLGIQGVGSFSLLVDDIRDSAELVTKALGGRAIGGIHEGEYAESQQFRLAGLTLSLLHPKRGDHVLTAVLARQGSSIHSFCLVVSDMDAARKELLAKRVAVLKERVPRLMIHPRSAYGARILLSAPEDDR
jgi:hypothetical protein